jgi:hypothetical protein
MKINYSELFNKIKAHLISHIKDGNAEIYDDIIIIMSRYMPNQEEWPIDFVLLFAHTTALLDIPTCPTKTLAMIDDARKLIDLIRIYAERQEMEELNEGDLI